MSEFELDLDLLRPAITGTVPFSVRYGYKKISDYARKSWMPPAEGTLWGRMAEVGHDHDMGGCTCGCPVPDCPPCGGFTSAEVTSDTRHLLTAIGCFILAVVVSWAVVIGGVWLFIHVLLWLGSSITQLPTI